jgi:hypothetical protein
MLQAEEGLGLKSLKLKRSFSQADCSRPSMIIILIPTKP